MLTTTFFYDLGWDASRRPNPAPQCKNNRPQAALRAINSG